MKYPIEEFEKRYENMSDEIKSAVSSVEIPEKLAEIAKRNNLHIDDIGVIEEEVSYVLFGLEHPDSFVQNIKKRLNLNDSQAQPLASDINSQIFAPIRASILKMQNQEVFQTENQVQEEPSKDSILAEIENPAPAEHPISIAAEATKPAIPLPREITAADNKDAQEFVANKLAEPVSVPHQTAESKPTEKPKEYGNDPYREPIS